MSRVVRLVHRYDAPAAEVWRVASDLDCLAEAMEGLIAFEGLPSGRIYQGQEIAVRVSLFGRLPWQDYRMRLEVVDDETMQFLSDEVGAGVKSWRHSLRVVPEGPKTARIEDEVEIDAGLMTPLVALWARYMYRRRHGPRLRMLGLA